MTRVEFLGWIEFWKLCPFDDQARYFRPAALLANAMNGAEISDSLRWLDRETPSNRFNAVDMSFMAAFGVKPPPRKN